MLFALAALIAAHPPAATAHDPMPDRPLVAWLSDSDYPAGAISRGVSGTVGFRLDVGAIGAPTRCTVTQAADAELDRTTCDVFMARAHFQPARDSHGRAVAGTVSSRVRWVLPEEGPPPFIAMRVANVIGIDAQGNVTCTMGSDGAPPANRAREDCGFLTGSGAAQAMRAQAAPADLIVIFTLVPEGGSALPGNEEAGAQLIREETAHLVIARDGAVADCQPGAVHNFQSPLALRFPPACWMQGAARFTTPAPGQEARQAEIAMRIYFRRRAAH
jgi:Gram-negative bacterial TonB protein C-terminal